MFIMLCGVLNTHNRKMLFVIFSCLNEICVKREFISVINYIISILIPSFIEIDQVYKLPLPVLV
jgi:hypothetical protein